MAISSSHYGQIGKPRVFVNIISYARAVSYIKEYYSTNVSRPSGVGESNVSQITTLFNSKPSHPRVWSVQNSGDNILEFNVSFKNYNDSSSILSNTNKQWSYLLQGINWYGVFGHTLGDLTNLNSFNLGVYNYIDGSIDYDLTNASSDVEAIIESDYGFSMYKITSAIGTDNGGRLKFQLDADSNSFSQNNDFEIASLMAGRYIDFSVSPDLEVKRKISNDGVKRSRTLSGGELYQVNSPGNPMWGSRPAWSYVENVGAAVNPDDTNPVGVSMTGRRSWDVSFSFIDKQDIFAKSNANSMAVEDYDASDGSVGAFPTDLSYFYNFTLQGQIPFVFQVDTTDDGADEFAMCVIKKGTISMKQEAFGVYSTSMTFEEVW